MGMITVIIKRTLKAKLGKRAKDITKLEITVSCKEKKMLMLSHTDNGEEPHTHVDEFKQPLRSLVTAEVQSKLPKNAELQFITLEIDMVNSNHLSQALYVLDNVNYSKDLNI